MPLACVLQFTSFKLPISNAFRGSISVSGRRRVSKRASMYSAVFPESLKCASSNGDEVAYPAANMPFGSRPWRRRKTLSPSFILFVTPQLHRESKYPYSRALSYSSSKSPHSQRFGFQVSRYAGILFLANMYSAAAAEFCGCCTFGNNFIPLLDRAPGQQGRSAAISRPESALGKMIPRGTLSDPLGALVLPANSGGTAPPVNWTGDLARSPRGSAEMSPPMPDQGGAPPHPSTLPARDRAG
ncbi:MAG: hypothetical protein RLZZ253_1291 [Verrucomicrobiota bacterium]